MNSAGLILQNDNDINDWGWFIDLDIQDINNYTVYKNIHKFQPIMPPIYEEPQITKLLYKPQYNISISFKQLSFKQLYYKGLYMAYNTVCNIISNCCLLKLKM